jgi:hypothetical protein
VQKWTCLSAPCPVYPTNPSHLASNFYARCREKKSISRIVAKAGYTPIVTVRYADQPAPVTDYIRQARRLRARHQSTPARLHQSLMELSSQFDQTSPRPQNVVVRDDPHSEFAHYVQSQLEGPILRYSLRLKHLREAERRGIGRFEANLIIAAVQHRAGERITSEPSTPKAFPAWMMFFAIEFIIVFSVVWMFRH